MCPFLVQCSKSKLGRDSKHIQVALVWFRYVDWDGIKACTVEEMASSLTDATYRTCDGVWRELCAHALLFHLSVTLVASSFQITLITQLATFFHLLRFISFSFFLFHVQFGFSSPVKLVFIGCSSMAVSVPPRESPDLSNVADPDSSACYGTAVLYSSRWTWRVV